METLRIQIPDTCKRIILCGGPYSNFSAVEKFLNETASEAYRFCLGDIGGFGPLPNRTLDLIRASNLICLQGNYDEAVGFGQSDCGCGYLDPLDRHFAQVSFDYTFNNTSETHRQWLRELPKKIEMQWGAQKIDLCHGSPENVNDFVWASETKEEKLLGWLNASGATGICATHSGIPWHREFPDGRFWLNVGVLGRPAHTGRQSVNYAVIERENINRPLAARLVEMTYDIQPVIKAMRSEGLPEEFAVALETGIWTTCFKILPPTEARTRKP